MKSENPLKHVAIPFLIALLIYVVFYFGIENRRTHKGPWGVTFTNDASGTPTLIINQIKVGITNLQITFPGETNHVQSTPLNLSQPQQVPYDVPFGTCVFMDTTFLPGTVVFNLFGHEIQLIPRVLTIDKKEIPWESGKTIAVSGTNGAKPSP
jgi:hypothetical protein